MLGKGEMALLKLSELMNHSAPDITRRYTDYVGKNLVRFMTV